MKEIYGRTEASGLISCNPGRGTAGTGSVGLRFPYTRHVPAARRRRRARGKAVTQARSALSRSAVQPSVPDYRVPAQGAGTFQDGVLVTGDLGCLDDRGPLVLQGRAKDLIIRSGHNIDSQMIESALHRHPDVLVAAAVGQPDAYAGELPVCYVELRPGSEVSEDELRHFAKQETDERPAWRKRCMSCPTCHPCPCTARLVPMAHAASSRLVRQARSCHSSTHAAPPGP